MSRAKLKEHVDAIEESYEFFLAYAAQGLLSDTASPRGAQLREFLERADTALGELPGLLQSLVAEEDLEPAAHYQAFLSVLTRDAQDSRTALQLVRIQPSISSQLIDNLNASIHLRALLTDLFLIDEILRPQLTADPGTGTVSS